MGAKVFIVDKEFNKAVYRDHVIWIKKDNDMGELEEKIKFPPLFGEWWIIVNSRDISKPSVDSIIKSKPDKFTNFVLKCNKDKYDSFANYKKKFNLDYIEILAEQSPYDKFLDIVVENLDKEIVQPALKDLFYYTGVNEDIIIEYCGVINKLEEELITRESIKKNFVKEKFVSTLDVVLHMFLCERDELKKEWRSNPFSKYSSSKYASLKKLEEMLQFLDYKIIFNSIFNHLKNLVTLKEYQLEGKIYKGEIINRRCNDKEIKELSKIANKKLMQLTEVLRSEEIEYAYMVFEKSYNPTRGDLVLAVKNIARRKSRVNEVINNW